MNQIIVIGGGLAGLSACHTVLERGGRVCLLEKMPFCGGNSTKATSGINGTLTRTQIKEGVKDSVEAFLQDTIASAAKGAPNPPVYEHAQVLTRESGPAVEWLIDAFGLDLSLLGRLGGHSFPRTHRGKERFPGMTITYALMEKYEDICSKHPERARLISKARATRLITDVSGACVGVVYEKDGQEFEEKGNVIIATGGYGADFSKDSILMKHRPDVGHLPTTNGVHCTGDGIKLASAIGGDLKDMTAVQVHPTGLVHPDEPDAKVKFLAAEALRGCGALLVDANGKRFCNELGRRDYVSGEMFKGKGPYTMILNSKASNEIKWHCEHYKGRGLFRFCNNGDELAKAIGCSPATIKETFRKYNEGAAKKQDPFGKKFFANTPFEFNDTFHIGVVTPVVHYTMGGLKVSGAAEVESANGPIPGLWAAGEVMGGVHGQNRLGGSSLLDCVVYGRVSGRNAAKYLLENSLQAIAEGRVSNIAGHLTGSIGVNINPAQQQVTISWGQPEGNAAPSAPRQVTAPPQQAAAPAAEKQEAKAKKDYTMADVAKHNKESDCWVVVNGEVLDVTKFLPDHPGGKHAILLFAGKDASKEFNMLHKPDVVEKYAADSILGNLKE